MGPILVPGEILVEIMADQPGHGFREPLALTGPYPSGAPAIFAAQAARLGAAVAMVSAVGRDDFGRLTLERLGADGVDISAVAEVDRPTGTAFVRYRPGGGRDFVFNLAHAACGQPPKGAAVDRALAQAGHLHVMGSSLSIPWVRRLCLDLAPRLKARGGTLSFDPNLRPEVMSPALTRAARALLPLADVFLPSGAELWLLTGTRPGDAAAARDRLFALGVGLVVHKKGSAGASVHHRSGDALHHPAFPVEERDPTGAGDCFGAAFVTAWRGGQPLPRALARACAAGALAVTRRGPMEGAAWPADLDRLLG